jgi:hypothetical protein
LIKTGQEQVQIFRQVIQAIEATTQSSTQNPLYDTLSRARKTVEELRTLITVKLIRQRNGSAHARRRAWLKHKSKIVSLRNNLKDAGEKLSIALETDLLSEISFICTLM